MILMLLKVFLKNAGMETDYFTNVFTSMMSLAYKE